MKFLLGTKESMTQIFADNGQVAAGTVVAVAPTVVIRLKTKVTDGYEAVEIGYGTKKAKRLSLATRGHVKKALGKEANFRYLREFRDDKEISALKSGDEIKVSVFKAGDPVAVSGISKGKGFQGVVKRHGFSGGPRSHGQKHSEREPGSISGGGRAGGRVSKGVRMGGRMGADRVTVKNLKVLAVDEAKNTITISGAVPGRRGTLLEIRG